MEIMPIYSPHPVETNIFVFRILWSEGYRSYAHFADIASLNILEGMVSDQQEMPGLSQQTFEPVRAAYLTPYDLKKIDIGGGMVHGNAKDFQEYTSIVWALRCWEQIKCPVL